jgi:CBS domain-containing protein
MAQKVSDIMTTALVMIRPSQSVTDAARAMRDNGIGAVLVADNGELLGIASDRDIVVRAVADGKDPARTAVAEVCSADVVTATPSEDAGEAVRRMREHGVRRIPVVEGGNRPVGILSIGDMAIERDEGSALADISVQTPNT